MKEKIIREFSLDAEQARELRVSDAVILDFPKIRNTMAIVRLPGLTTITDLQAEILNKVERRLYLIGI